MGLLSFDQFVNENPLGLKYILMIPIGYDSGECCVSTRLRKWLRIDLTNPGSISQQSRARDVIVSERIVVGRIDCVDQHREQKNSVPKQIVDDWQDVGSQLA